MMINPVMFGKIGYYCTKGILKTAVKVVDAGGAIMKKCDR